MYPFLSVADIGRVYGSYERFGSTINKVSKISTLTIQEKGEEALILPPTSNLPEPKVCTDMLKAKLQALGNLKGRLDGVEPSKPEEQNEMFTVG